MKDFNFFYIYSKKLSANTVIFLSILFLCIVLLVTGYIVLSFEKNNIYIQINEIDQFMSQESVKKTQAEYTEVMEELELLQKYEESITQIINNVNASIYFDSERMLQLNSKLPKASSLISISFYENMLLCEFEAPSLDVATELIAGINTVDCLEDVKTRVVKNNGEDDNSYEISIEATLKGGQ